MAASMAKSIVSVPSIASILADEYVFLPKYRSPFFSIRTIALDEGTEPA